MKSLLELVPFLNGYPLWLRATIISLPPLYTLAVALLYVYAPPPPVPVLTIDTIRRLAAMPPDILGLDVIVHNPTTIVANITEAVIELYAGQKPTGGLASALTVSGTYRVEKTDEGLAVSDESKFVQTVSVVRPYAGQSYARLTVPLAQTAKAGAGDRFVILLRGAEIVQPDHNKVEVTLGYNDGKTSPPMVIPLKR
ncbi:MAG TPA: hypothetical protein VG986_19580 [Pseudolabrys sp.]|nr:hypothetical protein [Pseudolabrys sp.]